MRSLWLGARKDAPKNAECLPLTQVPSLTSLALQQSTERTLDAVILDARKELPYSLPHLLDAAGRFQRREIFFCVLASDALCKELSPRTGPYFLCRTGIGKDLLTELEALKRAPTVTVLPQPRPIALPAGRRLLVNVFGSQGRIGCTTQCLRLYRWLAASGLQPAIAVSAEDLSALMRVLAAEDFGSFVKIEGIPFVTAAEGDFNCYIRDCGLIDAEKAQKNADISILIAGAKPWELEATVAALSLLRNTAHPALIGSFVPKGHFSQFAQIARRCGCHAVVMTAPWQPDPFSAEAPQYDRLRPLFEIQEDQLC